MEPRQILRAEQRLRGRVDETPLIKSPFFTKILGPGSEALLKLENLQITGSFKARGALNALLQLTSAEREAGVIVASAGNHGKGICYGAKLLGIKAVVVVPITTPETKTRSITEYGSELLIYGESYEKAEAKARELSRERGSVYISGYNHPEVIYGQGTVGLEIFRQCPDAEIVLVPVGGGGLLSGVAMAASLVKSNAKVIGVQSEASPVMNQSLKAKRIVDVPLQASVADGLHGGIEQDSVTFPLVRRYSHGVLLVSEEGIKRAMRDFYSQHQMLAEGAGAVGLAALSEHRELLKGKKVVVVISGGNVSMEFVKGLQ